MPLETTSFNVLDHLKSEVEQAAYLGAALEEGDAAFIAVALGDIAAACGMPAFTKKTGIDPDIAAEHFRDGGAPSIQLVAQAAQAFGLKLKLVAA